MAHGDTTDQTRSRRLTFRLTPTELNEIESKAEISNLTSTEYIRRHVLGRQVKQIQVPPINQQIYGELVLIRTELRKQGTNLNQIAQFLHVYKHLPQESAYILSALETTIENLGKEIKAVQFKLLDKDDREN